MKANLFSLRTPGVFAGLLSLGLFVAGCNRQDAKDSVAPAQAASSTEKVEKLLERAYLSGTAESYAAITAEYQQLTAAEFELFSNMKTEKDLARLESGKLPGARVDQTQKESIVQNLKAAQGLRSEVNKQALATYGKTLNQLSNQQLSQLMESYQKTTAFERQVAQFGIVRGEPNGRTQACPLLNFPFTTVRTNNPGNGWLNYTSVINEVGEWPCDYEYNFAGRMTRIRGDDWFAVQLLDSFGGNVNYRLPVGSTKVILGFGKTTLWIGHPWLTSISMLP
ncbi:MAG: hypothetical protein ICV83_12160 [Cytophagales bacterium]|nr:hypothetical protein [Cytophagales bacterium]